MPRFTVEIDDSLYARIAREAERRAGDEESDPMPTEEAIVFLCDYALRRIAVLAKHANKVKRVKKAIRNDQPLPPVEFKRYVPIFKKATLDAEGTPREVAKWAHAAPENKAAEIGTTREAVRAKPPTIRKAKRQPVGRIESVVNPEVVAAV